MTGVWKHVRRRGDSTNPLDSGFRRNDGGLRARSSGFVMVPSIRRMNTYLVVQGPSAHHPADSTCKTSADIIDHQPCAFVLGLNRNDGVGLRGARHSGESRNPADYPFIQAPQPQLPFTIIPPFHACLHPTLAFSRAKGRIHQSSGFRPSPESEDW